MIGICGICRYAEPDTDGFVHCTNALSWFAHKLMPIEEGCTKWRLEDQEPPAAYLEAEAREPGGESDSERETRVLTERGGRVGGTW